MENTNWNLYLTFFYIGIFVIALAIIIVFYVSYAFSRKRLSFTWPIITLKYIALLFVTILFLPFLYYFISMLACVPDSTKTPVHALFTDVPCWTQMHILHATFAIIGIILFLIITTVLSLTYFEYRNINNDPTAR